jgi:lysophospholipase L1-like esterase
MDNGKTLDLQLEANAKLLPIDITQYGAVGDGITDCMNAFNSILDSSEANITSRIINSNFSDGNTDGVADNWVDYTKDSSITGTLSINGGQVASVTNSTAVGGRGIYQSIPVRSRERIRFSLTYKSSVVSGTFSPAISVQAFNDNDLLVGVLDTIYLANSVSDVTYQSNFYPIPTGATKFRLYFLAYANAAGDKGTATFKSASLTKKGGLDRPIKFPQNADKTAVYYFSEVPVMDGYKIDCDDGVVLSIPTTNGVSFTDVIFKNDISIYTRDRINTSLLYKSDTSELAYYTLAENDQDIGVKKLTSIPDASVSKTIYTANAGSVASAPLSVDSNGMYYMANAGDIAHNMAKMATLEFNYTTGKIYSCDYEFTVPETSQYAYVGVTFSDGTNANWGIIGMYPNGTAAGVGNVNSVVTYLDAKNYAPLLNDAYRLVKGVIFSIRPITNRKFDIYLNGFYMQTFTTDFDYTKIGFGMICVNQTGQGLQNVKWGRLVSGVCKKHNYGGTLKIGVFGDSITYGAVSISWAGHLNKFLVGQKGITKLSISNYAVSGNRSSNQLSTMQALDLSGFDMILILIGTNDIQSEIPLDTFKANVQSMITLAKANNRKVIIGIPPMWISETLTMVGSDTNAFEKGAAYRSVIMKLVADNDIYIADTMSEIGRIGVDNATNTLIENIHPNVLGQVSLARCFARSILEAVTSDVP